MNNDWYEKGELPPVGETVLVESFGDDTWVEVEIVAHSKFFGGAFYDGDSCCGNSSNFKPLKSKQDQEREDFINTFLRDSDIAPSHTHHNLVRAILRNVFDAGYRKVKPLSLSVFLNVIQDCDKQGYQALLDGGFIVSEGE